MSAAWATLEFSPAVVLLTPQDLQKITVASFFPGEVTSQLLPASCETTGFMEDFSKIIIRDSQDGKIQAPAESTVVLSPTANLHGTEVERGRGEMFQ